MDSCKEVVPVFKGGRIGEECIHNVDIFKTSLSTISCLHELAYLSLANSLGLPVEEIRLDAG